MLKKTSYYMPMKSRRNPRINFIVQGFGNGNDLLFGVQRFSRSTIRNIAASVFTVGVGVAILYMTVQKGYLEVLGLQFATEESGFSKIYVPGLQNLGNNCFLNVILQALASCGSIISYLQDSLAAYDSQLREKEEEMPLVVALASLLEELSPARDTRVVLNPRKVMKSLSLYVNRFSLARQQDAAEAFAHLLSSLDEEISQFYAPHGSSLADIMHCYSRVQDPILKIRKELPPTHKYTFGPLGGTIGSLIICKSCSSLISLNFEFFRCLPLSPLLDKAGDIIDGCTLVDCLRKFTSVEHLEHYRCGRCWHRDALQYLSLQMEKDEVKIQEISQCINFGNCHCEDILLSGMTSWGSSKCAVKQLSVAKCPKVLCIHLQRVFMSTSGEPFKLQGHVSFPLVLNLLDYAGVPSGLIHRNLFETKQEEREESNTMQQPFIFRPQHFNSGIKFPIMSDEELDVKPAEKSDENCLYRLVSVVEHYGRAGSGHYAVYRRSPAPCPHEWFYVSDHEVAAVEQEAVLSAEASLLFYEKIF